MAVDTESTPCHARSSSNRPCPTLATFEIRRGDGWQELLLRELEVPEYSLGKYHDPEPDRPPGGTTHVRDSSSASSCQLVRQTDGYVAGACVADGEACQKLVGEQGRRSTVRWGVPVVS